MPEAGRQGGRQRKALSRLYPGLLRVEQLLAGQTLTRDDAIRGHAQQRLAGSGDVDEGGLNAPVNHRQALCESHE